MKKRTLKSVVVKISPGNRKTGKIPSVSLPPIEACAEDNPCFKDCYILKAYRMYPNVREAYRFNYELLQKDRNLYFDEIAVYLSIKSPKYFRWHVSGDIQDQDYLELMKKIAMQFPETRFLAFTKCLNLNFKKLPPNLSILASMWPGWGDPKSIKLPKAWMQDGTETRIPKHVYECLGSCDDCHECWILGRESKFNDVLLKKH